MKFLFWLVVRATARSCSLGHNVYVSLKERVVAVLALFADAVGDFTASLIIESPEG